MPDLDAEQRAEALRQAERWAKPPHFTDQQTVARALIAAEAEVAELREEVLFLCSDEDDIRKGLCERAERAEARVKRLEEALDVIANDRVGFRSYSEVFSYARAALSEPTEGENG